MIKLATKLRVNMDKHKTPKYFKRKNGHDSSMRKGFEEYLMWGLEP